MRILLVSLLLLVPLSCGVGVEYFTVARVIDGDTIVLADGTRVRYIGIDTPERGEVGYKEATEANRKLVEDKKVRLEYDVNRTDRYGRTLAYVYVNGTFVNAWLLENGLAEVMTIKPNVKYKALLKDISHN